MATDTSVIPLALINQAQRLGRNLTAAELIVLDSKLRSVTDFVDYARQLIEVAEGEPERCRREKISRRRAILTDNWSKYVDADIRARATPQIADLICGKYGELIDISRNPARDIWSESAVLYKQAANRFTEPRDQGEVYIELTEETGLDTFWQSVELGVEAFNDVVLWPSVVEGELRHNWAAGDTVCVAFEGAERRNPFAVLLIDSWTEQGRLRKRYFFETAAWRAMFDEDKGRLSLQTGYPQDDAEGGWENPLGELRYTFLHRDPYSPHWWDTTTGEDLVQLSIKTGRHETDMQYMHHRSSHKQLLVSGEMLPKIEGQLLDVSSAIKIQGSAISSQLIDWQVDFAGRLEIMNTEETRAAASRGINAERLRKSSYQSADAAQLAERGLTERRERKEAIFRDAEARYYRKVCLVADANGLDAPDPDVSLQITYAPIEYPTDPLARLALSRERIRLGVESPLDIIKADHPTWPDDRCLEELTRNVAIRAQVAEIMASRNIPTDPGNQSATAEQNGAMGPMVRDNPPQASDMAQSGADSPIPDTPPDTAAK